MKKIGQIMDEMGFNADSSPSSKAAFIKYLAKQAYNVDLKIPEIYQTEEESGELTLDSYLAMEPEKPQKTNVKELFKKQEEQLEFNLDEFKIAE